MLGDAVRARVDPSGLQVIDVTVHLGYRPNSIRARARVPLRIIFLREDDDACSERVVFSAPRLDRRLSATGATTVDLPAQPAGEIRFTCGMGRYRGTIELVDDHDSRPPLARLRHWLAGPRRADRDSVGLFIGARRQACTVPTPSIQLEATRP